MINFALAREIYGLSPWFVDQETFPALMGMFNSFQNGNSLEIPETKYNTPNILEITNEHKLISRPFQLDNNDVFNGIGIINIDGPITVSGGESTMGMRQVSDIAKTMALDERIKAFILLTDSGGGSSAAVEIMSDTINEIKQTKKVIGLIKKGGMAASAAFGILSAADEIFAESEMSIVGSAGTMIQFEGRKANSEDPTGLKHIRLFASKSKNKNKGFEEALNNDDFDIIINEMLNPINEDFLKRILQNRPMLEGTNFDDGHTVFAKDAIGTFIDGIESFEEVLKIATRTIGINKNLNNKNMNIEELKSKLPEVYSSIFDAGVLVGISNEKDRIGSWMAHSNTDLKAVKEGIESGDLISMAQREEFLIKGASFSHLKNLQSDSKKDIKPIESKLETVEDINKTEADAFYAEIDSKLKLKTT